MPWLRRRLRPDMRAGWGVSPGLTDAWGVSPDLSARLGVAADLCARFGGPRNRDVRAAWRNAMCAAFDARSAHIGDPSRGHPSRLISRLAIAVAIAVGGR